MYAQLKGDVGGVGRQRDMIRRLNYHCFQAEYHDYDNVLIHG